MPDGPLAYLITFRTYGSWLHGDDRGSVGFRSNEFGTEKIRPNPALRQRMAARMNGTEQVLDAARRAIVESTVEEVCEHREWALFAIAVRTNHVHLVVYGPGKPELILAAFKAWTTRRVKEAGLIEPGQALWSQGGSRVYVWRDDELERACSYVIDGQGEPLIPQRR